MPCIIDMMLPDIGESIVKILRKLDVEPFYHKEQTCCGLIAFNSGMRDDAKKLAKRFLDIFDKDEVIVCPSGSCVHMVTHNYKTLFCDDPKTHEKAEKIAAKTFEFTQYLVDVLKAEDLGAEFNGKVAYHESCSLLNGLGISEQPKKLIRAVKGAEIIQMAQAEVCCGFGGKFSHVYSEISGPIVAAKVKHFMDSGADVLIVAEPGCFLNISGYISKNHPDKKVMHLADFIVKNIPGAVK
jgi:L-lactate dehydrogenase complex protein LldE